MNRFSIMSVRVLMQAFLKIFFRDKQSIFFSIFFPVIFMFTLGIRGGGDSHAILIGVVNQGNSSLSQQMYSRISDDPNYIVVQGNEQALLAKLADREISAVVYIPDDLHSLDDKSSLKVVIDSSHLGDAYAASNSLQQRIIYIENDLRGITPTIDLQVEDVQSRALRYIDFLLPGLLAFSIMQISIAGSGFNLVEYRRKGILKRLFVTPVRPIDVIAALVGARLSLVMLQATFLILIAVYFLDVQIMGNIISLYVLAAYAAVIFLCMGFALGSVAKTQASIQALGNLVIFPQMFLSGMFYPISSLPEVIQPIASVLPLSFVANALREIMANGVSIIELLPDILGMTIWLIITLFLATKLFVWKDVAG